MKSTYMPMFKKVIAKVLAATSLFLQSLVFLHWKGNNLEKIDDANLNPYFTLKEVPTTSKNDVSWLEITQVGKPLEQSSENCFTAMQKILYSCFMPKETQLLFFDYRKRKRNRLYLGVRPMGTNIKKILLNTCRFHERDLAWITMSYDKRRIRRQRTSGVCVLFEE